MHTCAKAAPGKSNLNLHQANHTNSKSASFQNSDKKMDQAFSQVKELDEETWRSGQSSSNMASMRNPMRRGNKKTTPIPKGLNPDLVRKEELFRQEREKKYDTREWRELKNISDMGSESQMSVLDSDNGEDYLIKGLNWNSEGDIGHLTKQKQKIVKKQRELSRQQGGLKYIGVLKGIKLPIKVDPKQYRYAERRQYSAVEWYETHKTTHQIFKHQKLDQFENMLSSEQEEELKFQKMIEKMHAEKEKHQREFYKCKYTAEQLKNCRDNAGLMGEKKVKQAAELEFMINQWNDEEAAEAMCGGKLSVDMLKKLYGNLKEEEKANKEELNQFMMLHNYIDKYQEKLGLSSTSKKKSQVEKVLAFVNKCTGRTAQDVVVDFATFKKAKTSLLEKSSVRSTLRETCERRGLPKRLIEQMAPTEISMSAINAQLRRNQGLRNEMSKTFGVKKRKNRHGREALQMLQPPDEEVERANEAQTETKKFSRNDLERPEIIQLNQASSRPNFQPAQEEPEDPNEEDFERSLSPPLKGLLKSTWADSRPNTNKNSAKRNMNYASNKTLASDATRPETSLRLNQSNGRAKIKKDNLFMHHTNRFLHSKDPSQSSFDATFTPKSCSSKPSFISPMASNHASAQKLQIASLSATAQTAAKLTQIARQGTLKDIYHQKLEKYSPSPKLATPKVKDSQRVTRIARREIDKRSKAACFTGQSRFEDQEVKAHRMSSSYFRHSSIGRGRKVSVPQRGCSSVNKRRSVRGGAEEGARLEPTQVKRLIYGEMVVFEDLAKDVDESNDKCRNGLRVLQHPKKYQNALNRDNPEVSNEIRSLEKRTDSMYDKLNKNAEDAADYLKSAQCIRLKNRRK